MFAVVFNNAFLKLLPMGEPFTVDRDGVTHQYPANWLALSSQDIKEAHDIYPVVREKHTNTRYTMFSENTPVWDADAKVVRITYQSTPVALSVIKQEELHKIEMHGQSLLQITNKMILDAHDHGIAVAAKWVAHRQAVRDEMLRLKHLVNLAETADQVVTALSSATWAAKPR